MIYLSLDIAGRIEYRTRRGKSILIGRLGSSNRIEWVLDDQPGDYAVWLNEKVMHLAKLLVERTGLSEHDWIVAELGYSMDDEWIIVRKD